jgi:hypothetical protein
MKKVIRLTESDLVKLVRRIVKESDEPRNHRYGNVNLDAIDNFDEESYDDVDDFLSDVFPSTETYFSDLRKIFQREPFYKLYSILSDVFGIDTVMDYLEDWSRRTERY